MLIYYDMMLRYMVSCYDMLYHINRQRLRQAGQALEALREGGLGRRCLSNSTEYMSVYRFDLQS